MKKIPVILLLTAALLLSACQSVGSVNTDAGDDSVSAAETTDSAAENPAEPGTTSPDEAEAPDGPNDEESTDEESTEDETFKALLAKYPIVSAPSGIFASSDSAKLIADAAEKVAAMEDGVLQIKASVDMNLGAIGNQNENFTMTLKKIDGAYQSVTETVSSSNGESDKSIETVLYVDGCYYYLYEIEGDEESTVKYKVPLTAEKFKEYISGESGNISDVDLGEIAALFGKAMKNYAGMTEDGGCTYFAHGYNASDLSDLALFEDMLLESGELLTEDSLSNISIVFSLDKDGALRGLYFDLPLEISISEGGFSMSMSMAINFEITVQSVVEGDKIEAPADADSYELWTEDDLFISDDYWDDWMNDGDENV